MHITRKITPEVIEERGNITRILDAERPIRSVLLITSKEGTTRSNHYHKTDAHYCYLISGKMQWYETPVDGGQVESAILEPGDMVYTPPMTIHAVKFLQDSVFLAFTTRSRHQGAYEPDTVRVTLIE